MYVEFLNPFIEPKNKSYKTS